MIGASSHRLSGSAKSGSRRKTIAACQKLYLGAIDQASKWEGLPLTSLEDVGDVTEGPSLIEPLRDVDDEDEQWWKSPKKFLKVLLPHVALIAMLLSYTALGAIVLQLLEDEVEVAVRQKKVNSIRDLYSWLTNETWVLRQQATVSKDSWTAFVVDKLRNISQAHEGSNYHFFTDESLKSTGEGLKSKWTFPTAVLYALTVLTTCGYDHVGPLTDGGKIFAVVFALIGIPLMFITAADIGKFLSEMMLKGWRKWKQFCEFLISSLTFRSKAPVRGPNARQSSAGLEDNASEGAGAHFDPLDMDQPSEKLWFPIGAYVTLICLYCAIGALLYTSWEDDFGFIRAFHFSFNLITTVGLGNIMCTNFLYLGMIVAYVIIGLAVVTMCVDLASSHLKAYFTKIHYFGRARSRFLGMSEDIREMMQIIAAMRKKKGAKVTWNDLRDYLRYEQQLSLRPFTPHQLHMWRYIDETSSLYSAQMQMNRRNSMQSDVHISYNRHKKRSSAARTLGDGEASLPPNGSISNKRLSQLTTDT